MTKAVKVKKWLGSQTTCDICNAKFKTFFVDGATKGGGSWALMCPLCYLQFGVGLGSGRGQKYDFKTKVKMEG